jgi:hypothetical protein
VRRGMCANVGGAQLVGAAIRVTSGEARTAIGSAV